MAALPRGATIDSYQDTLISSMRPIRVLWPRRLLHLTKQCRCEENMRFLFILVGVSLITVPESEAGSKPLGRAQRYLHHSSPYAHREPKHLDSDGWYPHDASKLPVGTRKWFDQMLRENRRNPG